MARLHQRPSLVAVEEARPYEGVTRPAILVRTGVPGGATSESWVYAEIDEEGSRVRLHAPAAFPTQARLFAWRAGEALLVVTGSGPEIQSVHLTSGNGWTEVGPGFALRLVQLLPSAMPGGRAQSTLAQLSLETAQGPLTLRQGEALRIGDVMLRLVRR